MQCSTEKKAPMNRGLLCLTETWMYIPKTVMIRVANFFWEAGVLIALRFVHAAVQVDCVASITHYEDGFKDIRLMRVLSSYRHPFAQKLYYALLIFSGSEGSICEKVTHFTFKWRYLPLF